MARVAMEEMPRSTEFGVCMGLDSRDLPPLSGLV
jgi:hypothetical protein